jgi:hypothetical protein
LPDVKALTRCQILLFLHEIAQDRQRESDAANPKSAEMRKKAQTADGLAAIVLGDSANAERQTRLIRQQMESTGKDVPQDYDAVRETLKKNGFTFD